MAYNDDKIKLHDRAERASYEARKLMIQMSTGGVGLFFLTITDSSANELTTFAKAISMVGVAFFGISIICAIAAWKSDAKRSYFRAKCISVRNQSEKQKFSRKSNLMHKWQRRASYHQTQSFIIGLIATILYSAGIIFKLI